MDGLTLTCGGADCAELGCQRPASARDEWCPTALAPPARSPELVLILALAQAMVPETPLGPASIVGAALADEQLDELILRASGQLGRVPSIRKIAPALVGAAFTIAELAEAFQIGWPADAAALPWGPG